MLVDLVPGIKRVGVLWDPTFPSAPLELKEIESAARFLCRQGTVEDVRQKAIELGLIESGTVPVG